MELLHRAGYQVAVKVMNASLCGVPQNRKRCFVIGALEGGDLQQHVDSFYESNVAVKPFTVREFFGDGLGTQYYYRHARSYQRRAIYSIDEPSATVRGVNRPIPPNYKFHPNDATTDRRLVRHLTTVERSLIQTFPAGFSFDGISRTDAEVLVGNAVPVRLAEFVARCLREFETKKGESKNYFLRKSG
jgi:DNA (cytosine-5)-methyltransferase 1